MKCIDLKTKYSRNKLAKLNSQTASPEYYYQRFFVIQSESFKNSKREEKQ
jgi:hypothetical protein